MGLKIHCECPLQDEGPPELAGKSLDELSLEQLVCWIGRARGFCVKLTVTVIEDDDEPYDVAGIDAKHHDDYAAAEAWEEQLRGLVKAGTCTPVSRVSPLQRPTITECCHACRM